MARRSLEAFERVCAQSASSSYIALDAFILEKVAGKVVAQTQAAGSRRRAGLVDGKVAALGGWQREREK